MSDEFDRVLIIGTGLIGGSLAARIRNGFPETTLVGIDADPASATLCLERGYLDQTASLETIESESASCDLVFLCTPPDEVIPLLPTIAGSLGEGSIATDVASVKGAITTAARRAFDGSQGRFFGGHPMSGGPLPGAQHAGPELLDGATWCLVPIDPIETVSDSADRLETFLQQCGFIVVRLDENTHDRIVARTSHLPHLLASCLARSGSRLAHDEPIAPRISGPSFEAATRVAAASPSLWQEILQLNRTEVRHALDEFLEIVRAARLRLEEGNLSDFLAAAQEARKRWEKESNRSENTDG